MIALAALLKAYPGAVGGYFLFRRRFRAVGWAVLFGILGVLATGLDRWRDYFAYGAPTVGVNLLRNRLVAVLPNLYQLQLALFCPSARCPVWLSTIALAIAIDLSIVAAAAIVTARAPRDSGVQGLCFGIWLIVALLLSPISWDHELPLMLPAYLFLIAALVRQRATNRAVVTLLVAGLGGSMLPFFAPWFLHLHLYLLSTLAICAAACIQTRFMTPRESGASQCAS